MLSAINITKTYPGTDADVTVLRDVSLEIDQGEFVCVVGKSGSGKSTLLGVLSTLIQPSNGQVLYDGLDLSAQSEAVLNRVRQRDFAIIFQMHHLLPYLTVLENTMLPFMRSFSRIPGDLRTRATLCLERVGLEDMMHRLPGRLSGGEQQRVAIARALVSRARVLFADEPTGSLDRETGRSIMQLLTQLNSDGMTVVLVTHDAEYAQQAYRSVRLEDGRPVAAGTAA